MVAVVAGAIAVIWFLPQAAPPLAQDSLPLASEPESLFVDTPAAPALSGNGAFNLKLFNRTHYQGLNLPLINNGSLPVQPPAVTGKANPFL